MNISSQLNASDDFRIGVLTSGGDTQGMNAAIRAVIRAVLAVGTCPYAVLEGWAGAVHGGDSVKPMGWFDVSSILSAGDTVISMARCPGFHEYEGRHAAAHHPLEHGIDRLVVISGDGSLPDTNEFRTEWPQRVRELVDEGVISEGEAATHPTLIVAGLVGSIGNDMVGTDMTIGADAVLHHIVDALDQLTSTATSHQRIFVVEVMGHHCGYPPLIAAVAGGADYVSTPENPAGSDWEDDLVEHLRLGHEAGRRESIVLVAEDAANHDGNLLTTQRIADAITEKTGEDARVTILDHVQRDGSPSAYGRWMSILLGYAAVQEILTTAPEAVLCVLGVRHNRITRIPLMKTVREIRAVKDFIKAGDFEGVQRARNMSFATMMGVNDILSTLPQLTPEATSVSRHIGILHAGDLAPGMNTTARAAVRLGIARGWTMLGIRGSWRGLTDNDVRELTWGDVEG